MIVKHYLLPISMMAGAIIGAGVFSLPYVFAQVGLLSGFVFLVLAAIIVSLVHLFYADLILRTRGRHNFVGFYPDLFWSFWLFVWGGDSGGLYPVNFSYLFSYFSKVSLP